ncbi:patatin-like phospholipase family protein [Candidatus Mesenet endosymbiont of Phosphuga atrata]|uniref:patatin-like phospholipase family protein n=1 Tax=Candidatus Mesenet endosymbiont of Phosphuga atrata TaxID=3066221 RepID=UPI0030CC738B
MKPKKYILSVDGGGIRGIIPAILLEEIEKRTNKPIAKIFDLMVGTSTGGIIVAGLCRKDNKGKPLYSANDMVGIYEKHGLEIFKGRGIINDIMSFILKAKYSEENIERVLGNYFGESTLVNVLTNLSLTSYDIHNCGPILFKSWSDNIDFLKPKETKIVDSSTKLIKLKDALRATTAAPTFFRSKKLTINKVDRILVDGGVFANNPATVAYVSSQELYPNNSCDITILSIGTGVSEIPVKFTSKPPSSPLSWVKNAFILNVMFNSGNNFINYQLKEILGPKYIRIEPQLKFASADLDNATEKNIKNLKQDAALAIEKNGDVIEEFCKTVVNDERYSERG